MNSKMSEGFSHRMQQQERNACALFVSCFRCSDYLSYLLYLLYVVIENCIINLTANIHFVDLSFKLACIQFLQTGVVLNAVLVFAKFWSFFWPML